MNTSARPILRGLAILWVGLLVVGCASTPPHHDAVVDQAWSRFLLCELPPEQRPEGCE